MSNWLTEDELYEYCGYCWKAKQQIALAQMGVTFTINARGRILVSRSVLDQPKTKRKAQPDWAAMKPKAA